VINGPSDPVAASARSTLSRACDSNAEWYDEYIRTNAPRIVADANFITRYARPNSSILDVGAIPPYFIELLRRQGFQHCAVADPHPEPYAEYFRNFGIPAHSVNLLNGGASDFDEQFDVVCMNEVIEHLAGNLLLAIGSVLRCVRDGGLLMVTTPNQRSFSGLASLLFHHSGLASKPYDGVKQQYDRSSAAFGYFGHVREYTKAEVINLFSSFGCRLVACESQPNYLHTSGPMGVARRLETLFPRWGLFSKYLFRKDTDA
jgi:SAM-dependent methyltransferase